MLGHFPKIPNSVTHENIRISKLKKRLRNIYNKEYFKPNITSMIETLPDHLYEWENEHAKGTKYCANIILVLEGKKCSKTYFNVLEKQHGKSNKFWIIY